MGEEESEGWGGGSGEGGRDGGIGEGIRGRKEEREL